MHTSHVSITGAAVRIVFLLLLLTCSAFGQFTDFYVDTAVGSSNIYSGSTASTTPTYISLSGNWNGTTTFTPTDGSTPASTVSAGMWAAISFTSVPSNAVYIAVVDTVNAGVNGTLVLSTTSKGGTAPASITGDATLVVGGVWKGPNTNNTWAGTSRTIVFPFAFAAPAMTNESSGTIPRINFKAGQYDTTNTITHSINGPVKFQGYTSTVADGGRATLNGGSVYPGYNILIVSGTAIEFEDFVLAENGASGSGDLVVMSGSGGKFLRCVFHDARQNGLLMNSASIIEECVAYACNKNNTVNRAGFSLSGGMPVRSVSYSNTTANASGFIFASTVVALNCVAAFNGRSGFNLNLSAGNVANLIFCDSYSNSAHGLEFAGTAPTSTLIVENCNFVHNLIAGITNVGNVIHSGYIRNNGFGTGSMTNYGGNVWPISGVVTNNNIEYASGVTPWNAPDSGDFRITLSAAKAAGRGAFLTVGSWTGTVAYPDIGAAQSASTNAAASGRSYTFAQ